jgi:hypothetical protein
MPNIENKRPRLPETGEGNKEIEIYEVADNRVTMRVMNEYITYGAITLNGKLTYIEISRHSDAQIQDSKTRRQYPNLEKKARAQAFAILSRQAAEKDLAIKARTTRTKKDPRQKDLFTT